MPNFCIFAQFISSSGHLAEVGIELTMCIRLTLTKAYKSREKNCQKATREHIIYSSVRGIECEL